MLGWSPQHDLKSIIGTGWNWHSNYLPAQMIGPKGVGGHLNSAALSADSVQYQ
jgi:hypothetical protein